MKTKYYYFVHFRASGMGQNAEVPTEKPITSLKDIQEIEDTLSKSVGHEVVVTNYILLRKEDSYNF